MIYDIQDKAKVATAETLVAKVKAATVETLADKVKAATVETLADKVKAATAGILVAKVRDMMETVVVKVKTLVTRTTNAEKIPVNIKIPKLHKKKSNYHHQW
ncbi:MAG: hypothetical protein K0Q74_1296 [Gammaproteobacteria bacterium]|nr:hypothetical protein [Gammaproteobacteria bacterium]